MAVERLKIGQVAARYDVSVDAVRRRIRSGLLPAQRDNHGQWWVELDPTAPPPASLAPPRPSVAARLAAPAPAVLAPPAAERVELHARAAAAEGEARGLREALRVAEATAAGAEQRANDATRRAQEAERRAEGAERAAVEAWGVARDLAQRLAAIQPPVTPAGPLPPPPRRKGLLAHLLGR